MDAGEAIADAEDEYLMLAANYTDSSYTFVFPWLILCAANDLPQVFKEQSGITHHINCASELSSLKASTDPKVLSLQIPIRYRSAVPLEQLPVFEECARFLAQCRAQDGVAVVNCARGRSRSVSVILYFCMAQLKMSLLDGYSHIKARRPFIGPSRHLQPQLLELEKHLLASSSFQPGQKWSDVAKKKHRSTKMDNRTNVNAGPPATAAAIDRKFKEFFSEPQLRPSSARRKPDEATLAKLRSFSARKKEFLSMYEGAELLYAKKLVKEAE